MPSPDVLVLQGLAAQASYALLDRQAAIDALVQSGFGDMPTSSARRFLGLNNQGVEIEGRGLSLLSHTPNWLTGFSASLFQDKATGTPILAIRGSEGPADVLQ